jgi:hypothetical protein
MFISTSNNSNFSGKMLTVSRRANRRWAPYKPFHKPRGSSKNAMGFSPCTSSSQKTVSAVENSQIISTRAISPFYVKPSFKAPGLTIVIHKSFESLKKIAKNLGLHLDPDSKPTTDFQKKTIFRSTLAFY